MQYSRLSTVEFLLKGGKVRPKIKLRDCCWITPVLTLCRLRIYSSYPKFLALLLAVAYNTNQFGQIFDVMNDRATHLNTLLAELDLADAQAT